MTKEIKLPTYEDGTPVCFGDTILDKRGISFIVDSVGAYSEGSIGIAGRDIKGFSKRLLIRAGEFVKRGDTWEQLEKDAEKICCEYFGMDGELDCEKCITRELIRRAKKLAGVEDE